MFELRHYCKPLFPECFYVLNLWGETYQNIKGLYHPSEFRIIILDAPWDPGRFRRSPEGLVCRPFGGTVGILETLRNTTKTGAVALSGVL